MGPTRALRIYVDTSVFGGCHDAEFAAHSQRFFDLVRGGRVEVLLSDVVLRELAEAPEAVRAVLERIPPALATLVALTGEVLALRDAYLEHGVVGAASTDDAAHVACATAARADAIVSWNFKHIVRLDRIRRFNAVNLLLGYGVLTILSPTEVQLDEGED